MLTLPIKQNYIQACKFLKEKKIYSYASVLRKL